MLLIAFAGRVFAQVPKTWDERLLADWATPIAALGVRPGHFSEIEYYKAPLDNLRTYPVYFPGREPAGYWEMLQKIGPQPLIEPVTLKTEADWIRAGMRVFEEFDVPAVRSFAPEIIEKARNPETYAKWRGKPRPDGTLPDIRWVPTAQGVALGGVNCAGCHERLMPDQTILRGAPPNEDASPLGADLFRWASSPIPLQGDTPSLTFWRSFSVPWIQDDVHEGMKLKSPAELGRITFRIGAARGLFPRWNGSPYYTTKVPDLIGIKDRRYIDHTATHQHRGPGDVMRYAALVTYSDISDFGPHRLLTAEQRKIPFRLPDEALYALTEYLYSLQPPPNPNRSDPRAAGGRKIFEREGCAGCHTPPLYTNNKLTLAVGFTPPKDHAKLLDILAISVGTDPGLALKTRKGTGYYKVPSLKGVWYRGRYLHDGALTKLEEMFDPARLNVDYVPSGFMHDGLKTRAIKGHKFGLKLSDEEKTALVAFLNTL